MSTSKWEEKDQNLEQRIIEVASSHVNILSDSFEAYFPSHQAAELKSKLWIWNSFGKQQPAEPLGQILKNDFCQQAFFNRGKHAEFWVGALRWSIQRPGDSSAQSSCAKPYYLFGRKGV